MIWLEMSRDYIHGGGNWGYSKCLWSPTYKNDGKKSGYWELMKKVQEGDIILHLRENKKGDAYFEGFSMASTDGFETSDRPPHPGDWGYAERFYRVLLKEFSSFNTPISMKNVLQMKEAELRDYFLRNKDKVASEKKKLFFVIQNNKLQRQNGAYLSEIDEELVNLILDTNNIVNKNGGKDPLNQNTLTSEKINTLKVRIGQKTFSDNVKKNYNNQCCFPGCSIEDVKFLRGSHIARWADAIELRGDVSNGLCLCLMHDQAFEIGLFTVTIDFKISINKKNKMVTSIKWCKESLIPYDGELIKIGKIPPSREALEYHWERIGYILFQES